MMRVAMLLPRTRATLLLGFVLTTACGRPSPEPKAQPRPIEDPAELEELEDASRTEQAREPKWKRAAPSPMPETFVAFELPDLAALDGAWLVESEVPKHRVLWLIEEGGAKLTEVDHRGRERVYSMSIASPCALRLTDERGHTRSRSLALHDGQLIISRSGATAVRGRDGSMLACLGHRTYQIAPDGRCRYTSEMLGSWTEPAAPDERCELGKDDQGPVLTIAEQHLREQNGLWLDEKSTEARARAVEDRASGLAQLASHAAALAAESAAPADAAPTDAALPSPTPPTEAPSGEAPPP
jgi:hypothetical protein